MGEPTSDRAVARTWSKFRRVVSKNWADLKSLGVLPDMGQSAPPLEEVPFVEAAFKGDLKLVSQLMSEGANLTQSALLPDYGEASPLGAAICVNDIDIARLLIDNMSQAQLGIRYGPQKLTALHLAAGMGRDEIAEALVAKGADLRIPDAAGNTPLVLAVQNCHLSMVWIICEKAKMAGLSQYLDEYNSKGQTALQVACELGELAIVSCLLKQGADPNKPTKGWGKGGQTPLWVAAMAGHADCVQTLLTSGTRVNIDMKTRRGLTLLHLAVLMDHPSIVSLLMEHGADIETGHMRLEEVLQVGEDFPNPLLLACAYGRPECLQALLMGPREDVSRILEKPCRVDATAVVVERLVGRVPEAAQTPMAWAVQFPCKLVRKSLRVMGIGGEVQFTSGADAMDARHAECVRVLLAAGAGITGDQLIALRAGLDALREKGEGEAVVGRLEVVLRDAVRQCEGCGAWGAWPGVAQGGPIFCSGGCRTKR
ncbi:unnamed protein product [Ostreobium quekettii]|uniref:Uncharacterized protein n=1 Tax=Ostreobium quekettii TaxID=121088 RepID=A0A8S1JIA8_9CHLO|nr:unnamed protein product [Ostreobium quekettii]|eukprot:evm.model.scf_1768.1 EVM.evm.TU.scf_1768.1   scf_1768:7345-12701(-)